MIEIEWAFWIIYLHHWSRSQVRHARRSVSATVYSVVCVYMLVSPYDYEIFNRRAMIDFIIEIAPHGWPAWVPWWERQTDHYTIGIEIVPNHIERWLIIQASTVDPRRVQIRDVIRMVFTSPDPYVQWQIQSLLWQYRHFCMVYVDDVTIGPETLEEHKNISVGFYKRCKKNITFQTDATGQLQWLLNNWSDFLGFFNLNQWCNTWPWIFSFPRGFAGFCLILRTNM